MIERMIHRLIIFGLIALLCSASCFSQTYKELASEGIDSLEAGSYDAAVMLMQRAIELEPESAYNVMLFANIGTAFRELGKNEDAIAAYSSALNYAPLLTPVLQSRAVLYVEEREYRKAITDLSLILDVDSVNENALLLRGYSHNCMEQYADAERDYEKLCRVYPDNKEGKMGLAIVYGNMGKYEEAIQIVSALAVAFPEDAEVYMIRANIEFGAGYDKLALSDIDIARSLAPDNVDSYLLEGDIYAAGGDFKMAEAAYGEAVRRGYPPELAKERMRSYKENRKNIKR